MAKRWFAILAIGCLLLSLTLSALPAQAADPIEFKEKVAIDKQPTDAQVLGALQDAGVDKSYVEVSRDYNTEYPYSQVWSDRLSDTHILLVSNLPQVNSLGQAIDSRWYGTSHGDSYESGSNLFFAGVTGSTVTVTALNDQPSGAKQFDSVIWSPLLFLNGNEIRAPPEPTLLAIDPTNENYSYNTLEWDYGIAKRRVRVIEGRIRDRWYFNADPKGEVRIQHNSSGKLALRLGSGYDTEGELLAVQVEGDTEIIPASEFARATYPVIIGGSPETFYPDAHEETSSVDGEVGHQYDVGSGTPWATIIAAAGTAANDDREYMTAPAHIQCDTNSPNFRFNHRGIETFDTSGLPDICTLTGATQSFYGKSKQDDGSNSPTANIYSSDPVANTALEADDYDCLGDTPFCDTPITYNNWNTGTPGASNDFVFNASGLAAISKTGITKLGLAEASYDKGAGTPSWGQYEKTQMWAWSAEKGNGYKPQLVVTYTEAPDPPANFVASDNLHDRVTCDWDKSVGATKYQVYRDGAPIGGELGDVDTYDDMTAGAPTITAGNAVATDGTFTDKVSLSLAGTGTNDGTTYTYKVRAGSAAGWSGDSNTDNGKRIPGALSYQWEVDRGGGWEDIVGAIGATYDDTGSPAPTITPGNTVATDGGFTDKVALSLAGTSSDDGDTNNYRCKLTASGCANQTSGADTGHTKGGALSYQWEVDRGVGWGDIVGAIGATYDDVGSPAGTITPGAADASDGTFQAHVTISVAGESVADGATNNYRCSLTAPDAAGQTSAEDTGYRTTGAITYQAFRSAADVDAGYVLLGGATTDPYNDATAPADGSGRWYYCEVSATGAVTQDTTHDRGFRGAGGSVPAVITLPPIIGWMSITLRGEVTSVNDGSILSRGFVWGLGSLGNPGNVAPGTTGYTSYWTESGSYGTGEFTSGTPVEDGIIYYGRACALNSIGWAYGGEVAFDPPIPLGERLLKTVIPIVIAVGLIIAILGSGFSLMVMIPAMVVIIIAYLVAQHILEII